MMRIQGLLFLMLLVPVLWANPCLLDYKGWLDPTVIGFTYNGVKVRKGVVGKDTVQVEVTANNKTNKLQLTATEWAAAESGCAAGTVPQDIKTKLGIPNLTGTLPEPVQGALDFDVGDLNGDGLLDHVKVVFQVPGVLVELGTGPKTLGELRTVSTGQFPRSVLIAEFNGDGRPDLVVAHAGATNQNNGTVTVLLGNGDGTFRPPANIAQGGVPTGLAVADWNADQRQDVVVVREGNSIGLLLGNGDGTFRAETVSAVGSYPQSAVAADFNGDGRLDLAVGNRLGNSISVLYGTGNGAFSAAVNTPTGDHPLYLTAADLNADGRGDLLVLESRSGTLATWLGEANNTLRFGGRWITGNDIGSFTVVLREEDGYLVMSPDGVAGRMFVYGVNADGSLSGEAAYLAHPESRQAAEGDFNNDGKADLALLSSNRQTLTIALSQSTSLRGRTTSTLAIGQNVTALTAGDFNSDSRVDLAVAAGGRVGLWYGNGAGGFQAGPGVALSETPVALATVDLNGDRRPDVVALAGNAAFALATNASGALEARNSIGAGLSPSPWLPGI
ncbi:MAG: hypothetical protein OHK0021_10090 [Bryobacter sp.]